MIYLSPKFVFLVAPRALFIAVIALQAICVWGCSDGGSARGEIVSKIKKLGGTVVYDWNDVFDLRMRRAQPGPWEVLPIGNVIRADVYVQFYNNPVVNDDLLTILVDVKGLQALDLRYTAVTDKGLRTVSQLDKLKALLLDGTRISDAGLRHMKSLTNLEELHLNNVPEVSGAGLKSLAGLNKLRYVHAYGTAVTERDVRALKRDLPKCVIDISTVTHRPMAPKLQLYPPQPAAAKAQ